MSVLKNLEPKKVFEYFEAISSIPRGSQNMEKISDFCINFANEHSLKAIRDDANNVIIYKPATKGYENSEPIILQGHLDIVCQKNAECNIDFLNDGLDLYIDGDFIKANGTTLGADNGIAVAMILSILESNDISHPAIEAVFTTDEEIGMIGATALDTSVLTAKKMINLDSEDMDTVTVSCAGGSDFKAAIGLNKENTSGTEITVTIKGLNGGHSGICINEGRVNANILAGRFLNKMNNITLFKLISINGGDKGNAITPDCEIKLLSENPNVFLEESKKYIEVLKNETAIREPNLIIDIIIGNNGEFEVITDKIKEIVIFTLLCAPNGVIDMSAEIKGLVETSLNLGILKTEKDKIIFAFALRSNKKTALKFLEEKLTAFFSKLSAEISTSGHYPPWEFNNSSTLLNIYKEAYVNHFGSEPKVEAIHAGLECGVFADSIKNFDAIAIGPQMYDVHTVNERLSISSTSEIYKILLNILKKCK